MSEGQLKKQLQFYALNYATRSGKNVAKEAELYLRKQEDILDEAKADAPRSYTEESKTETVVLSSGKVMPALHVHVTSEEDWQKWFEKWFGKP